MMTFDQFDLNPTGIRSNSYRFHQSDFSFGQDCQKEIIFYVIFLFPFFFFVFNGAVNFFDVIFCSIKDIVCTRKTSIVVKITADNYEINL